MIVARRGADTVKGRGGDDVICAGGGADLVRAGGGNDVVLGGRGKDDLRGRAGSDTLTGGAGTDIANGGAGTDICSAETEISCDEVEPSPSPTASPTASPTTSPSPSPTTSPSPSPSPSPSTPGGGGGGPVNQGPVVDTSAGNTAYTENAAGVVVDNALTVSDADDTNLESATVSITGNFQMGDNLGFTDTGTIDGTYTPATGVLTLVGTDTVANYQAALRTIEFSSTHDDPPAAKTVSFVVNDGSANSAADTKTVALTAVDDLPTAVDDSAAVTEDAAAAPVDVLSNDDDPDGGTTISSATDPANGTVVLTGGSPGAHTGLTYQPDPDYCNTPPGGAPDTFTYTLNGGSTGNVSMTVNCVDDPGTAVDDSATVNEDSGANTIDVLANDSDGGDGGSVVTSVSDPANGAAAVTNAGANLTYTPDSNYCNNPPGTSPDTFTYTITGGSTATVSVTVDCVDDSPVAVDDTDTVNEDSAATPIDVLANDTDVDGGPKTISGATDPADGTVVLTGGSPGAHTGLTYQPDPDYCNNPPGTTLDTFNYTVNGGDSGTVTVTVDCVNDAPSITAPASTATLHDSPVVITGVSVSDVDAGSDDVELSLAVNDGTLTLSTSVTGGVSAGNVTGNDTSSVVVTASLSQINNTLADANGLTYVNDVGFSGSSDTLSLDLSDLGNNGSGGALTDSDSMTINFNAPPVAAGQNVTTDEDTPKSITLSASDDDGDAITSFDIVSGQGPSDGGLGSIGSISCSGATPNVCTADVTYTPDPDFNGSDSFKFTATDGTTTSNQATVDITVDPVNDAPVLADLEGTSLSFTEGDAATPVTSTITVTDVDSAGLASATVQITGNYSSGDTLSFTGDASTIGIAGAFDSGSGTLTLTGPAGVAQFQAALRLVEFGNTSDNPATLTRTVTFQADDGEAANNLSNTPTRDISVTAINDAPVVANPDGGDLAYTEDSPSENHGLAVAPNLTVADADSPNLTEALVEVDVNYQNGQDFLLFSTQNGITGNFVQSTGVLTLTGSSSVANYQTALRSVEYQNTSDTPSTSIRSITFQVNDGEAANNLSNVVSRGVAVTATNDAPVADDETFNGNDSAHGNTTMQVDDPDDDKSAPTNPHTEIAGDILDGDTDVDGPGPLAVTAGTFATNDGGSVTLESDGDFVFQPAASTSCTDTSDFFDYTVEDSGSPEQTDTGRVTIAIAGCVWYVNNDAAGNSGTSTAPFDTLAQAETASGTNHTVFVFDGDNTSTGLGGDGYQMDSGERLIGEHSGLVVDPDAGGALTADTLHPANPNAHPSLTATNAYVISLDDGNEIRGFTLLPDGAGGGITGATGDTGGGTVDAVNITDLAGLPDATGSGIDLSGTTGTFNISNLAINIQAIAVRLNNAGTVVFAPASDISLQSNGAKALDVTSTALGTSTFDFITTTNSPSGGVLLSAASGTIGLGDGSGIDLSLQTTSGSAPALQILNSGTVTVGAAGSDDVRATGGPAIDITGTSGATLEFDDVDSTNSANDGINLDGLGTGTFSAGSGDIGGAAGISFDLNGGSGAITYPGNLNNGSGTTAIDITGRSGGVVTLSGPISDTNDAGGGLNMSANTGGSTVLSNATKQFNTGAGDGVLFNSSDGHTLTLSSGGLDIDTTSGKGLEASTSGTLAVTGSGNTIDTGTGRALNVTNTDIAGADVTLLRISANGASNGIVLNNTGSAGNLVVAGDGDGNPDGGGGVIQATTGHGIDLTSTASPSLTDITVSGAGDADNEYGMHLTNVTGTVSLDDVTFNGAADNLVQLDNANTNATFTVTGSVFSYPGSIGATANSAMLLQPNGTSSLTASVTGTTFTDIKSASLQIGAATAGSSGSSSLTFSNNTINSGAGRAGGVVISPQEATATNVTIQNNTFTGAGGNGVISIDANDTSTVTGTISGNGITNAPGIGIFSAVDEGATSTLTFNNNTITNSGGDGFQLVNFGGVGTSTMNATVTNNTVNGHSLNTAVNFLGGMSFTSFEDVMDLQLTGNTVTNTPAGPTHCGGAPCVDYFLQESTGTFRLEEIPDTAATTATAAYVNSTNDAGPVDIFGTIDLSNGVEISSS